MKVNTNFDDAHCYDAGTKEYLYSETPQKGHKGEAILPADSTQIAPSFNPNFQQSLLKDHVYIFDIKSQSWSVTYDFRGTCYNKITLEEQQNTSLRELQDHLTKSIPDMEYPIWDEEANTFKVDVVKREAMEKQNKWEKVSEDYREESSLGLVLDSARDNLPLSLDGIKMDCKFEDIEKLYSGYNLAIIANDLDMVIRTYENVSITIATNDCLALVKKLGKVAQVRLERKWDKQDSLG